VKLENYIFAAHYIYMNCMIVTIDTDLLPKEQ